MNIPKHSDSITLREMAAPADAFKELSATASSKAR
jgi:hypothetical protein